MQRVFYQHLVYQVISQLPAKLSIDYGTVQGTNVVPDCSKNTAAFTAGIHGINPNKTISPVFDLQFSDTEVTLSLQDKKINQQTCPYHKTTDSSKRSIPFFVAS